MKTFFGGILMAIGILIAGASGLCTITVLISALSSIGGGNEFSGLGMIPIVGIVGGIPFAIGVGLIFAGRSLMRSDTED